MSKLAPRTDQDFQDEAFSKQFCMDKLSHYWELRQQQREGLVNATLTEGEIEAKFDMWLAELTSVTEKRWIPATEKEKRLMNFNWGQR